MPSETGFSEIELKKFSDAGRVIAAAVGTSVELWARAEAGVILKTWAGRTKVATQSKVDRSALIRAYRAARRSVGFGSDTAKGSTQPGQASINLGIRGVSHKVYYRTRKKGLLGGRAGFQDVYGPGFGSSKHIADRDWSTVSAMVSKYRGTYEHFLAAARQAIGLSRQSIVQIADDLGIRLESVKGGGTLSAAGIAKARAALASNGTYYRNGYGVVSRNSREFYLTLVNRYPKLGALSMDKTLQWVISGRLRYFQKNLEEGVFLSASSAVRAYPYLEVLRTSS